MRSESHSKGSTGGHANLVQNQYSARKDGLVNLAVLKTTRFENPGDARAFQGARFVFWSQS